MQRIERMLQHPHEAQQAVWQSLMVSARNTEWGKKYDYRSLRNTEDYAKRVPVQEYETLKPYIERMMYGERHILWPGRIRWFSKSSGTTADKSKYIPVSKQNLRDCHIQGTWDTMTCFYDQRPDARQFEGKSLIMGGSLSPFEGNPRSMRGDVSAIMTHNMPWVARPFFTPDFETALMSDFEQKMDRMSRIVAAEKDLVTVGGVPTWTVVLFRKVQELTGKDNLLEVWPNLQAYIHGGVSFTPYREQFKRLLPSDKVSYQEIYNASEGYFALQDDFSKREMMLLVDNGVFYEFIPMDEWGRQNPQAVPLWDVEPGRDYAMLISTNSGLWRYKLGDTVSFTSVRPYRIKITGRTKQFINAFGEEVMVTNTDKALAITCREMPAEVNEYTVAPVYFRHGAKGGHQWLVEFIKEPADLAAFEMLLDRNLQRINSDYEAKRYKDMALGRLRIKTLPTGTFVDWLKSKGKFGGQHKVPRLANHRDYVDDILRFLEEVV
ncbi:MAG: GH3 auxin-responsive promoter family protein [Bacteroidetes bacterium]|nr:GH3 auxin-responsive promoter family protein [Bacteroidota bacterium]